MIVRLVGGGVLVDVLGQLSDQIANQFHLLQQQTDHDEAGVVTKLFHHQLGSTLGRKRKYSNQFTVSISLYLSRTSRHQLNSTKDFSD